MKQHELDMAELYLKFANRFPDMSGFWNTIVLEEKAHAEVINSLSTMRQHHEFSLMPTFTAQGLRNALSFVSKLKQEAEAEDLSELKALTIAINMEQCTLESNFFDMFKPTSVPAVDEIHHLKAHTRAHLSRLESKRTELLIPRTI
jgi:hypothetical protein